EQIVRLAQFQPTQFTQLLDHAAVIFGVRVKSRPNRRTADTKPPQPISGQTNLFDVALNRLGPRADLLPQPHGYGVLQMGTTAFNNAVPFGSLGVEGIGTALQRLA